MGEFMANRGQTTFNVGDWRVSPDEGVITLGSESVRLEPKVMEVLLYLASRPGDVVTRTDLEKEVWHGGLVGYDAVTSSVIKLRKALGDNARQPSYIATVPKRGYQLIAPVTWPETDKQAAPVQTSKTTQNRPALWVAALIASTLLVLAGLMIGGFWATPSPLLEDSDGATTGQVGERLSIVVLPFDNLSDDPTQEPFADGITEDIITDLSGISNLGVISSNTAFALKGSQIAAQEIGAKLKVDFVLEGSIRRDKDSVRINVQLVDAKTGFQKWAERYDRQVTEVFEVQDEVTNSIVEALAVKLTPHEEERLAKQLTSNLVAYDSFLEGQRLAKVNSQETNIQAQTAYRKAIESDPGYGRAYGALAYTLAYSYRRGWTSSPQQTIDRALELAEEAVNLSNSIPQTYWALGYVHFMRREAEQAASAVAKAIAIAPNYADGYALLALIKNALGESETAIELIRKGKELNPYYTWDYPYNLGRAYYYLGDIEKAIIALEEARSRNENALPVRLYLAASYVRAGRQDDAEWEVQEIQIISPTDTVSQQRNTSPDKNRETLNIFLEDLRKAGLPE